MTDKRIPLPTSGGSYTRTTKGLKQVETPTRKQTPDERRVALGLTAAPPAEQTEESKT